MELKSQSTQGAPSPQGCLTLLGAWEACRCGLGFACGVQPIICPGRQPQDTLAPVHSAVTGPVRSQLDPPASAQGLLAFRGFLG